MKRAILIFLLFITSGTFAQTSFTFGLLRGYPVGKYGSTNLQEGGSFAEPGWGIMIDAETSFRKFPDNLMVGVSFSYQNNPVEHNLLGESFSNYFNEELNTSGYSVTFTPFTFQPIALNFGASYSLIFKEFMSLKFKLGAGFMFSNINPTSVVFTDPNGDVVFEDVMVHASEPSFIYQVGVDFGFLVGDYIRIGGFVNHSMSNEKFTSQLGNTDLLESNFFMTYINPGISLSFILPKIPDEDIYWSESILD